MAVSSIEAGSTDQSEVRELVRDWAAAADVITAVRNVEQGRPDAWRPVYRGLAELGIFGVALPEEHGGADGTVEELCVMVDEAAAALVPGPVATTAIATLLVDRPEVLTALASGERVAGVSLSADLRLDGGRVSGTADYVLGADPAGVLLVPAGDAVVLVDANDPGVTVEPLEATDFSRPLARVVCEGAAADTLNVSAQRLADVAAAVLAAEAAGVARWTLQTATEYAKVREQFGRPIGSFQAVKHMCAEMLLRCEQAAVAAADAARAVGESDAGQLSIAAAVAAAKGIEAAKANAKDCIQVLGGIGITWEHDAHLYLRRAYGIAHFLGGAQRWLRRVTALTQQGVRRSLRINLESVEHLRPEIAAAVAEVAALPADKQQVALAEAGLLAPHWPPPYGRGAGPAEQLLIDEELEKAGVVRPDLVIGWWAAPTILEHGSPEQIERFVPATLRGEIFWCQLFSEPGAGSDLASLRTKAVRVEGGWKLTGQKVWTSAAHKAQWGICLARTDPDAPKHKGITYFLVDMSSPGIEIRPLREITGDNLFNEVFLDDVFVPDELVVGQVNDGWRLARTTLANERVAMSHGTALGNPMEELLRSVTTLDLDAAEQDRIGELIVSAQVGSLLDQKIAQLALGGKDPGPQASVRKLIGVRHRQAVAETRMEYAAGGGVVSGREVFDFLNTRCLTIAGGTEQILLTMAGERLLGLPR
ncbi:acyl-CoA dehydrogenase, C-terminal domain protein [Mycolicibacterium hassiacum DSM 44199]|uniref:Acyl-CoA dehydrogenase, C-terminal domain protein n=1 Tax=Mycolicibacterium hassiacum (strain DSM 44199 / CIP 105218 / JCM 12690 / 3849) TaxID=1122247 RepID=K5BDE6_MYCHD|nr:acyl-CoA dehydrogenase [Mycolicibacterium hassiacum]EKF22157.1 acyl-CoA dehydrogenase, C-terminal domain protein [Mycolicibacterium hassiacum DSM 44199]MBX5486060.1 acyl-CoA dehydrogenase [Mycolicibacterium hassiacum]MDA4086601.1 acyl-CoA dehydrogenase [Mycolicibacterium hassiacum DSM 44199]VCT92058.1 Acyl-CoA dehydrogenase FadE34 [Mycolicibacterium hassiacum DSM 44199]